MLMTPEPMTDYARMAATCFWHAAHCPDEVTRSVLRQAGRCLEGAADDLFDAEVSELLEQSAESY
jgi:hypothetical protein